MRLNPIKNKLCTAVAMATSLLAADIALAQSAVLEEVGGGDVVVEHHPHRAAAEADGEVYFSLMADDAIYLGTDASERWTLAEFKAFADPGRLFAKND